ncbi:BTB/POZ domain-containing protein NPY4-like [Phalaenopsis equestris]|uniref:BTB/POZ domain-containing protein NPY4-like n=1 Tax=Phalaenopsis equestris TaxID=78828 RepID=UPI0009E3A26A|nr:BTB/POZ domain-containing protein NPY4-like [Phalaenopsis equestris]XP_020584285.1 BTB/POZ domain-containing protein NPY4-like [Phalaenopsis equestris]
MKFMKLGSKPDSFQTDCDNNMFVATELASDIIVKVGDVKFFLHKFPLLSKSNLMQKLVVSASEENIDEIHIPDIPGGPASFEICAKFCYGMVVTLNAYNVVAVRCAAEYLEMHETVEKGNLVYKIEIFLSTGILRGWRDSILVLQSTTSLLPWSEDLELVSHCIDSIASKACMDISKVNWSYTYSRKRLISTENGIRGQQSGPKDWWIEDLCELDLDLYSRVLSAIKAKGRVSQKVIGEALKAYAYRKLPAFGKAKAAERCNFVKSASILEAIVGLLPSEKGSVSCRFLLKLLGSATMLNCSEIIKMDLVKKIGRQLDEAHLSDLLFPALGEEEDTIYDVQMFLSIVREFVLAERQEPDLVLHGTKIAVGKLVDGYLVEIAKDPNQSLTKFMELANIIPTDARPVHDELYQAIDLYMKEHQELSKSERKKLCSIMDCRKLSPEASAHAIQNESLPLRVVVQVLYFEQQRATAPPATTCNGCSGTAEIGSGSNGSLRSVVTEENMDSVPTVEDIKSLKSMVLVNGAMKAGHRNSSGDSNKASKDKGSERVKAIAMPKKIFGKLLPNKGGSGSDTTGSPDLEKPEESKSTPLRNRRHSVS